MSVNIFDKSTGNLQQIAGNALIGGENGSSSDSSLIFRNKNDFPLEGETNILYIATDENIIYRWNGTLSQYISLINIPIEEITKSDIEKMFEEIEKGE